MLTFQLVHSGKQIHLVDGEEPHVMDFIQLVHGAFEPVFHNDLELHLHQT